MGTLEGVLLKDGGWRKGYRKRYFKMSKVYIQYFENEFCTSPKGAAVRGTIKNVEVSDLELFRFRIIFKSEVWDLEAPSKVTIFPHTTRGFYKYRKYSLIKINCRYHTQKVG